MPRKKKDEPELSAETLAADLRDALILKIRDMRQLYGSMAEEDQRAFCEDVQHMAENLVEQTFRIVQTYAFPVAHVQVGEMKVKGEKGIEAKIGAANTSLNREVLGDHVGCMAVLVMADPEDFLGEREPPVDPDQPTLPVGAG